MGCLHAHRTWNPVRACSLTPRARSFGWILRDNHLCQKRLCMHCIKQRNGRKKSKLPFTSCRQSSTHWRKRWPPLNHHREHRTRRTPRTAHNNVPSAQAHTVHLKPGKYTEIDVKQQEDLKFKSSEPHRKHLISQMHALSQELHEVQRTIHEAEGATVYGGGGNTSAPARFWKRDTGYGLVDAANTPRSGAPTATPRGSSPTATPRGNSPSSPTMAPRGNSPDVIERRRSPSPHTGDRSARGHNLPHKPHHHGVHGMGVHGLQEVSRDNDPRHLHAATRLNHAMTMAKKAAEM